MFFIYFDTSTEPEDVKLIGNLDVIEGYRLHLSCSYKQVIPTVNAEKFCIENNCSFIQLLVSFKLT